MNTYQIVANKRDGTWDLYCNDTLVGTFSDLDAAVDARDQMEAEDEQAL